MNAVLDPEDPARRRWLDRAVGILVVLVTYSLTVLIVRALLS